MKIKPLTVVTLVVILLIMLLFLTLVGVSVARRSEPHTFRLTYASGEVQEMTGVCRLDTRIGRSLIFDCYDPSGNVYFESQPEKVEVLK
jgi:hypothetical protein